MIDHETAGMVRLIGLLGLGISVSTWAFAERSGRRQMLVFLSAGFALLSALLYLLGAMASDDSGASRFIPRFP